MKTLTHRFCGVIMMAAITTLFSLSTFAQPNYSPNDVASSEFRRWSLSKDVGLLIVGTGGFARVLAINQSLLSYRVYDGFSVGARLGYPIVFSTHTEYMKGSVVGARVSYDFRHSDRFENTKARFFSLAANYEYHNLRGELVDPFTIDRELTYQSFKLFRSSISLHAGCALPLTRSDRSFRLLYNPLIGVSIPLDEHQPGSVLGYVDARILSFTLEFNK